MPGGRTKRQKAHHELDQKVKNSKAWKFISSIGDGVKSVIGSGKQIRKTFKSKKKVVPVSGKNNNKGNQSKLKF